MPNLSSSNKTPKSKVFKTPKRNSTTLEAPTSPPAGKKQRLEVDASEEEEMVVDEKEEVPSPTQVIYHRGKVPSQTLILQHLKQKQHP
jgi:hypothetical protein